MSKSIAFEQAKTSVDWSAALPGQVFANRWPVYLFFQSDMMFDPSFSTIIRNVIKSDNSGSFCMINMDRTSADGPDDADALYIDGVTTEKEYDDLLKKGGPSSAWLYSMDRYVCAPEKGEWSIYCERSNEIAVIALGDEGISSIFSPLGAKPINVLNRLGNSVPFPFVELTSEWRRALIENYTISRYNLT